MTITRATRQRVLAVITDAGMPLRIISAKSGVHISNVRTTVKLLAEEGKLHTLRAGTGEDSKHEVWAFLTTVGRDIFARKWAEVVAEKDRANNRRKCERMKARRATEGRRSEISLAAERREAERARRRAEAEAKALAKAERDNAQRAAKQAKLRKLTAAAGATVFKQGTDSPKPKRIAWADMKPVNLDHIQPVELPCNLRSKFEVDVAAACFSSLKPGQYIAPALNWVRALEAA